MSSSPVPTIQQSDLEWTEDEDAVLRALLSEAPRFCASRCLAPWTPHAGRALPSSLAAMLVSTLKDWKRGEKETRERLGLLAIGKRKRDVEDSDDEEEIEHKRAKHERNTEVENFFDKLEIRKDSPIPLSFRLQGLDKVKKILFPIEESYLEGKEDEDDFAKVPCDDADDMVF